MNKRMKELYGIVVLLTILSSAVNGQISSKFQYSTNTNNDNTEKPNETPQHELIEIPEDAPIEEKLDAQELSKKKNMIPLDLMEKMNEVSDLQQFFDEFIDMKSVDPKDGIATRFDGGEERSAGVTPTPAGCTPENALVSLQPDTGNANDPTVIYFPTCTRVKKCSGCCSHPLLSCQPIETKTIPFLVIKSQFTGGNKMEYRGKEVVLIEEHMQCKCDCRIKEKDCTSYQRYDPTNCRCSCTNYDEQYKCAGQKDKIWDISNCTCRCRDTSECTTGTFFDETACKCSAIPKFGGRVPQGLDRKRFILKPVEVTEDDTTKYQTENRRNLQQSTLYY